jgi:hypothetical protein
MYNMVMMYDMVMMAYRAVMRGSVGLCGNGYASHGY